MSLTPGLLRKAFDIGHRRQNDQFKHSINQSFIYLFHHYQHFLGDGLCWNHVLWNFFFTGMLL